MSECICNLINSGMVDDVKLLVQCEHHATTLVNIYHSGGNVSAEWGNQQPSKFSWVSVKDWCRVWWTNHVIDDYDNLWPRGE